MARRRRRDDPTEGVTEAGEEAAAEAEKLAERLSLLGAGGPGDGRRAAPGNGGLPRSLQRAANRGAGPRNKAPSPQLLAAADAGILTTSNTKKGSAGRKAVDHATFVRRRELGKRRGAGTVREGLGHRPPESVIPPITALVELPGGGLGYVTFEGLPRQVRHRIGLHDALIRQLQANRLSPSAFRRRVRRWAPVAGYRLASDPAAILGMVEERRQAGEPLGPYPEGGA